MPPREPQVLVLGGPISGGQPGIDPLAELPAAAVRRAADLVQVRALLHDGDWFPDLVIVDQTSPDQFSESEIAELISAFPLARWICSYSPWCDSDGRNSTLWPFAPRVPESLMAARLQQELALIRGTLRGTATPLTAGRDEVFRDDYDRPLAAAAHGLRVAIISPDREWADTIAVVFTVAGAEIVAVGGAQADVSIWDADPWNEKTAGRLRDARAREPERRIVALTGFPRQHELQAMLDAGATLTVPKLAPAAEIVRAASRHEEAAGNAATDPQSEPHRAEAFPRIARTDSQ